MIDLAKPDFAPGCYGGALTFNADGMECRGCPFNAGCATQSAYRLERLREELGVTGRQPAKKAKPATPSAHPTGMTVELPKKVQMFVDRIERSGVRITETLARGENPFTQGFLKLAVHVLLKRSGGVDRQTLKACYMHKFGWTEATAAPHATLAVQVLTALGAAHERNGRLVLKK